MDKKFSILVLIALLLLGCKQKKENPGSSYSLLAEEFEYQLTDQLLYKWYPLTVDSVHGGFLSSFNYKWEPVEPQVKFIVSQARHTWSPAQAGLFFEGKNEMFAQVARHGFENLKNTMWDQEYGGFYDMLTREGDLTEIAGEKRAYGNSFGIYALATYYKLTQDTAALNLAKKTFLWLEENSHDKTYGGYFQHLERNGDPKDPAERVSGGSEDQSTIGYKDYNSSIHLLEAFTELYHVWPDELVRERLEEMFYIVRDTMTTEKGFLKLFFEPDWTHVSYADSAREVREANYRLDHVTFGHDVETAYLLLEASHSLGFEHDQETLDLAKKMVDHSLEKGWDEDLGGFYYEGYYFGDSVAIINPNKSWWVEAEGLNALLLMYSLFPDETRYFEAFLKLWEYTKTYMIDEEYGGWYASGLDVNPESATGLKAQPWKTSYHNARALINIIRMLKELDQKEGQGRETALK
ncbi:MAG: AGE family epimerase/isomerase [Candidatus Cyclobacteriaceae bacterium M3_2C_046]